MLAILAKLVAGPLVGKVVDLIKGYQDKKVSEAALRAEVEKTILSTFADVAKTQGSVIEAEMRGENWLQRNWRPLVAVCFAFIVVFYGLLTPIAVGWFGWPPIRVGDQLLEWIMQAVMVCLGGYIGGRSLEKVVQMIVRK
jgi:hypothetical protein